MVFLRTCTSWSGSYYALKVYPNTNYWLRRTEQKHMKYVHSSRQTSRQKHMKRPTVCGGEQTEIKHNHLVGLWNNTSILLFMRNLKLTAGGKCNMVSLSWLFMFIVCKLIFSYATGRFCFVMKISVLCFLSFMAITTLFQICRYASVTVPVSYFYANVCLHVCVYVCLPTTTLRAPCDLHKADLVFMFGVLIPWVKHIQKTSTMTRVTLWPGGLTCDQWWLIQVHAAAQTHSVF